MSTSLNGIDRAQALFCSSFVRETMESVFRNGDAADRAAAFRFRQDRRIGSRDRRFLSNTLFACFRWLGWLRKAGVQDDWNKAPALASLLDGTVTGPVLYWAEKAGFPRERFEQTARIPDQTEQFRLLTGVSVSNAELIPEWARNFLPESLRSEDSLFKSLRTRPPLWLRAQTDDIPGLLGSLEKNGFSAGLHGRIPNAVGVTGSRGNLSASAEFAKGLFEIQDISSQCIGTVCMAKPKESWWDVCAGGGGKTLQLAAMMNRKGTVYATDIRGYKLDELKRRAARAAYQGIRCGEWDGTAIPDRIGFDGVLVDAPCSSSGRWRRNPDGRWTVTPERVKELCAVQRGILESACKGVKPGGILVYATCSLFECEDEGIVRSFLNAHPEFELEPFPSPWSGEPTDGMLRTLPRHADCDASFAARMRRSTITKG